VVGPEKRMILGAVRMVKKKSLDRAIDENKRETERKPAPREWAKWAGYDCGE